MTNRTHRSRRKPNFWLRATPWQRVGVAAAALVLPCCGGVAVIGSLAGGKRPVVATAPAGVTAAPAAERLAGHPRPVVKRKIVKRTVVAYPIRKVADGTLAEGRTRVRTPGVTGVRTRTYEIALRNGKEISRTLIRSVITRRPVAEVISVGTRGGGGCDPNYTPCVPVASDVDCAGGSGDGPAYVSGPVRVVGADVYGLDRDGDGTACDG